MGMCLAVKPIRLVTSGLHNKYTHNLILCLGFHSQDNYSPSDKKEYRSFLSMIDPTAYAF